MKLSTISIQRAIFMLVIPTTLLISDQIFGQNKQSNPDSQNSSLFGYPDGPARDPNVFSIGGTGGNNIIYAPGGSIAVNENPTYNNYTAAQLVQNILVTGCLKASNVTFTGVFNSSDPTKRQLGYFNKATSSFPMSEGLIMSSGYVSEAEGPNNSPSAGADLKGAGDADLTMISGYATHDAAILQFDLVTLQETRSSFSTSLLPRSTLNGAVLNTMMFSASSSAGQGSRVHIQTIQLILLHFRIQTHPFL